MGRIQFEHQFLNFFMILNDRSGKLVDDDVGLWIDHEIHAYLFGEHFRQFYIVLRREMNKYET